MPSEQVSHGAVTLPAGYVALHMEHLSPARGWHCLFDLAPMPGGQRPRLSPTEWTAAVVVVQSALAAAHVNIACTHGDARPNNVMVLLGPQMQVQQVYFVDLDWAGKAGARWARSLSIAYMSITSLAYRLMIYQASCTIWRASQTKDMDGLCVTSTADTIHGAMLVSILRQQCTAAFSSVACISTCRDLRTGLVHMHGPL